MGNDLPFAAPVYGWRTSFFNYNFWCHKLSYDSHFLVTPIVTKEVPCWESNSRILDSSQLSVTGSNTKQVVSSKRGEKIWLSSINRVQMSRMDIIPEIIPYCRERSGCMGVYEERHLLLFSTRATSEWFGGGVWGCGVAFFKIKLSFLLYI